MGGTGLKTPEYNLVFQIYHGLQGHLLGGESAHMNRNYKEDAEKNISKLKGKSYCDEIFNV